MERHLKWREEMREVHVVELHTIREELINAVGVAISGLEVLEQGGKVPGKCNRFS